MIRRESRRRARALQMLYALDAAGRSDQGWAAASIARMVRPDPGILDESRALVEGVEARRSELDALAQGAADNWRLERIAPIERNILRLAIHELLVGVTPPRVVIDEALWLTRRFVGGRAVGFINGVLDRVAREMGRL